MDGKAMIVCISRQACVQMYNEIIHLKPEWVGTTDKVGRPHQQDGVIRVVMTGSASDEKFLRTHVYDKRGRKNLENRFKNPKRSFKDCYCKRYVADRF